MIFNHIENFKTRNHKAFTVLEVLIVIIFLVTIIPLLGLMYTVSIKTFREGFSNSTLVSESSLVMSRIRKPLLQAKSIDAITASSLTFTADDGGFDRSFRIYLYNSSDSEPNPPYTESSYQLRFAKGSVAYGDGVVLSDNMIQPSSAVFSQAGNVISILLDMAEGDSALTVRTNVRPRNF